MVPGYHQATAPPEVAHAPGAVSAAGATDPRVKEEPPRQSLVATRVKIAGKLFGLATNDWHDHPGKRDAEHGYVMLMVWEAELRRKQRKEDPDPDE